MYYVRMFADQRGETHFQDVSVELRPADFAPPAPLMAVSRFMPASGLGFLSAPPGWRGDWHPAPRRQFMVVLAGQVEAEVSDGEVRRFGPGDVVLVEDTEGRGHRSWVVGEDDVVFSVAQLAGDQGT